VPHDDLERVATRCCRPSSWPIVPPAPRSAWTAAASSSSSAPTPKTGWLPEAIVRDDRGYVCTGDAVARSGRWRLGRDPYLLETSVPGIFACGDVRCSPLKRVAAAVGEGSMSIAFVHQFLANEERAR
jgi:thioredoxin reductase